MHVKRIVGSAGVLLLLALSVGAAAGKSDVADAAMRGDKAAVRALLAQKSDVNAPQGDGATALHWAVYRGDRELATVLIRAGADVKAANREGATPMWLASVNGDASMIEALLEAGADANEHLPLGRTPLMVASRTGNVDAMKVLIDRGADVNAKDTLRGTTPLMWAADEGHAPAIELLIARGADIKARSNPAERGRGPALGKSNDPRRAVAALAAAQAAKTAAPDLGALSALERGRGAAPGGGRAGQPGQAGQAGRGAGRGAAADDTDDAAVAAGFGRGPGPKDGGELTPLVFATRANDLPSVKALLAAGADINQTTGYGWSPLLVAIFGSAPRDRSSFISVMSPDCDARRNAVAPFSSSHWFVNTVRVSELSLTRALTSAPLSSRSLMNSRWSMSPLRTG